MEPIRVFRGNEPSFPGFSTALQLSALINEDIAYRKNRDEAPTLLPKTPEQLRVQFSTGRNVILFQNTNIVGFAAFYELAVVDDVMHWELGTVIVPQELRKQSIGKRLYDEIDVLHDSLGGMLYGTTKDERVVEIGQYHRLEVILFGLLHVNVRQALCYDAPCFTPTVGEPHACKRQYDLGGDCWLRKRVPSS